MNCCCQRNLSDKHKNCKIPAGVNNVNNVTNKTTSIPQSDQITVRLNYKTTSAKKNNETTAVKKQ